MKHQNSYFPRRKWTYFLACGAMVVLLTLACPAWTMTLSPRNFSTEVKLRNSEVTVTGRVTSSDLPEGMPGVNVMVKDSDLGTVTDVDGTFSLEVPNTSSVLIFSYVGYQTKEVLVGNTSDLEVVLVLDTRALDEVVVVGYGTQTKRDVSGSIAQLTSKDFNQSVNSSVDQLMDGKAAGVQVVQNSGEPGGGMSVDIRGIGSINAGSQPLYVIDGLPINNSVLIPGTGNEVTPTRSPRNPIGFLNPADIQSIDILKDASATAIYGARGANGVIMITTKSGVSGALQVDYNGQIGYNEVHNRLDLLGPQEYFDGINDIIDLGAGSPSEKVTDIQNNGMGTNWQDEIFRDKAFVQNNNLSFTWGNNNTNFMVSINNTHEEGVVKKTLFDRYSARFNLNSRTDKFNFGINATMSYIKDVYVPNGFDVNLRGGVINAAKLYDPTLAVLDSAGNYVTTVNFDIDNPVAIIYGNHMDGDRYRYLGSVFGEYFITPSLSVKLLAGGDVNNESKSVYKDRTTIIGNSLGGVATKYNGLQTNYLFEGTLNYNENFGDHHLGAFLGMTGQRFLTNYNEVQANNFTTDATLANNMGLADRSTLVANSFLETNSLISYLGRVNYSFKDRYLLTASYRIDGSSRFGEGNRYASFPSVSLGWVMNEEEFFPFKDGVDIFKLRASWGLTGNQEIGNNNSISTFASGSGTSYVLNDQFVTSLNPTRIPNPDLKWETTEQIDIGLDFSFANGRISGSIDWYTKNTRDMLLNLPVPTSSGFTSRLQNIGAMKNTGFEFALLTTNIAGPAFRWSTDLNFYTLHNEVTDLGGIGKIYTGSVSVAPGNVALIEPGQPLYSFVGYDIVGVWQEGDDFDSVTNPVEAGYFKYLDLNNDGTIDGDDRVALGNSFPDFSWGFGNTFSAGGFSLYVFFKGVHGVEMLNANLLEQYWPRSGVRVNRFSNPFLDRWTPTNPTNEQPSYANDTQHSQSINNKTVVDASYIKLQTVRLSYDLPTWALGKAFNSLEVYISGINLLTFSDYDGFDPAVNPNGSANFRIDWNAYPSARTFLLGVNAGF